MFCALAVGTAVAAASPCIDRVINDPHVPCGVLIDFIGPPPGVPFRMTWFEITFTGTHHRFEDSSVGERYDPNMAQVSLWAECQRLGYRFKVLGKTRVLVEGCVIDGKFHPAKDAKFRFVGVPPERYPRVFKPKGA